MKTISEILHRMDLLNKHQDGTRSLFESVAIPEVAHALKDWNKSSGGAGLVIGGCATSYHARPRATTDLDVLYLSDKDIPDHVEGFKRTRPGAFQHNHTHVEVEVIHPKSINTDPDIVKAAHDDAHVIDGVKVASPSGIVALKLGRLKHHDIGDIVSMHHTGKVDLSKYPLDKSLIDKYHHIISNYA
jgi:hypothetical protein